ncbi:MAG: ROK family protein [Pirellulaceae bacterium]|nr:ROK family protein [Planctomycetales bacterium]
MYLGIEIGGTKLQLAVGACDGAACDGADGLGSEVTLLRVVQDRVDPKLGAQGILSQIGRIGTTLFGEFPVARIGIGFGGPLDPISGVVTTSHQIHGWDGFPLVDWCRQTFQLPATVDNDCNVAALAEARLGAGRGRRTVFYVTVGTGVGGGLVLDGRVHGSDRPAVAEIGHLRPGLSCATVEQTVESLASGWGITRFVREQLQSLDDRIAGGADGNAGGCSIDSERLDSDRSELLSRCDGDLSHLDVPTIALAAEHGNALCASALQQAITTLGWAIAQAVTLLAPNVVVVGGGVSLIGEERFFQPLRAAVQRYVFPPLRESFDIVPAALGQDVVLHGSLLLARDAESSQGSSR